MQAEATKKFRDLKENKIREPGERFTLSRERFLELKRKGFVKEIEKKKEANSVQQS